MSNDKAVEQKTKQCKSCFKEIDARAKKCPNCISGQNILHRYAFILWVVFFIGLFFIFDFLETRHDMNNTDFNDYSQQVIISDTKVNFENSSCGINAFIIGMVRNDTAFDWSNVNFEVIIYDNEGNIIDTTQDNKYSFILPSNQKVPFKVSMDSVAKNSYASHSVRIISATINDFY